MGNKELEFEIIDDRILHVTDFDWIIDCIDVIYLRHSEVGPSCAYAIFIQQGSEIVELYFKTSDEMLIAREYQKLCDAIKAVRPSFDNSAEFYVLINYANLKDVRLTKHLTPIIDLEFKNCNLTMNGSTKKYNEILGRLNDATAIKEL